MVDIFKEYSIYNHELGIFTVLHDSIVQPGMRTIVIAVGKLYVGV